MREKDYTEDSNLKYWEEAQPAAYGEPQAEPAQPKTELKIIGQPLPRIDGEKVVTGKARYSHDLQADGMLFGKILRSPHACAEIVSVDLSRAKSLPGVRAALQLKPGPVKYAGEQVAAVAAVDEQTAEEALKLIQVEYKPLPFVVSEAAAKAEGAPQVGDSNNVQKFNEYGRGNIEQGFAQAEVVLERTYRTAWEIHHPAETHCSLARWDEDMLTVWDSTQAVHSVRDGLARALNMPASKVRVIKQYMGGGFGSKLAVNEHTIAAALLAREAGKPVKITLTRRENAICVGYRPSCLITIKGGARKDGTLTALHMTNHTCGGVGRGDRVSEPLVDIYKCPNVKVEEYTIFANLCASRATRAPGHPQGTFALEGFMEELAAELALDPLELRRRNYSAKNLGDTGNPYSSKGLDKCYDLGAEKIGWAKRNKKPGDGRGPIRRGMGVASQIWWGAGAPGTLANIVINSDGSVEAVCGTQDIGCGTRTFMAMVAAESLGLEPKDITIKLGDTDFPWAPNSGGSATVPSVAPAVRDAAEKAADYLKQIAAKKLNISPADVILENKKFSDKNKPENAILYNDLVKELRRETAFQGERGAIPAGFAYNSFGAQFAEVEVDIETGKIKVLKVVAVHEVGRVMNRLTAESQVVGGITQGLSAGLFEEKIMDESTGAMVNTSLSDYKIATAMDIPEIIPVFIDMVDPRLNNLGTKGLGEPPRIPASAAIANAVYNAIGVHIREIPMTPARVLEALKKREIPR
jgi:xanthine dehydrogenase YagR molybdenum-binding subunit